MVVGAPVKCLRHPEAGSNAVRVALPSVQAARLPLGIRNPVVPPPQARLAHPEIHLHWLAACVTAKPETLENTSAAGRLLRDREPARLSWWIKTNYRGAKALARSARKPAPSAR
jgi:hypothetical protein